MDFMMFGILNQMPKEPCYIQSPQSKYFVLTKYKIIFSFILCIF